MLVCQETDIFKKFYVLLFPNHELAAVTHASRDIDEVYSSNLRKEIREEVFNCN